MTEQLKDVIETQNNRIVSQISGELFSINNLVEISGPDGYTVPEGRLVWRCSECSTSMLW